MSLFPNKMIREAYESLDGKTLTKSSAKQRFTDQDGCTKYDYHAVQWLIDNGWVVQLKYNPIKCFVFQWKRKDQL